MTPVLVAPRPVARPWPLTVERWAACDAAEAAARLRRRPGLAWLDSSLPGARLGRWSIVASDPRWTLTAYGSEVLYDGPCGPRRLRPGAIAAFARRIAA